MNSGLIVVLLAACAGSARAQIASGADQIFQNAIGGRFAGMGGAGAAGAHDASAIYYNPAGLGLMPTSEVQLMRSQYYQGATLDSLIYGYSFKNLPAGAALQVIQFGVSGAQGTDAANNPTGSFGFSELAATAGAGARGVFLPDLSVGSSLKVLTRSLGGSSDRLLGVDLGAQYGPFFSDTLMFGGVIHNAVALAQGGTTDILPRSESLGASWSPIKPLSVNGEVTQTGVFRGGAEWAWDSVALRAGYDTLIGVTFGAGVTFRKSFTFDVSLANSSALGLSEKASLGYRFGAPERLPKIAGGYVEEARSDLERGDEESALKNAERAIGVDPRVDDKHWRRRAERLRDLLAGAEILDQSIDHDELASDSRAAVLARRGVKEFLEGGQQNAMLLFHVAVGAASRAGTSAVYMRLLLSASRMTHLAVNRDDIVAPDMFVQGRLKKAYEDVYGRRLEDAVRDCREAIVIDVNNKLAWTRLGSAYFASGDKTDARAAYEKALQLDPSDSKLSEFFRKNFSQ